MTPRRDFWDNPYAGMRARARLPQIGSPPTIDRYEAQILARIKNRPKRSRDQRDSPPSAA